MSGLLANACPEEPDALIALVRVCGGAPRVTGGSTRKSALMTNKLLIDQRLVPISEDWWFTLLKWLRRVASQQRASHF